jgi:hypothetical protein
MGFGVAPGIYGSKERISSQSIVGAAWFQSVLARISSDRNYAEVRRSEHYAPRVSRSSTCYITMSERMNNEVVRETLLNIKYARFCLRRVGTRYVFYHSLVAFPASPL